MSERPCYFRVQRPVGRSLVYLRHVHQLCKALFQQILVIEDYIGSSFIVVVDYRGSLNSLQTFCLLGEDLVVYSPSGLNYFSRCLVVLYIPFGRFIPFGTFCSL